MPPNQLEEQANRKCDQPDQRARDDERNGDGTGKRQCQSAEDDEGDHPTGTYGRRPAEVPLSVSEGGNYVCDCSGLVDGGTS